MAIWLVEGVLICAMKLVSIEKSNDFEYSSISSLGILSFLSMEKREETMVFEFPILDIKEDVKMKNINPPILLHFHGMDTYDLDTFLFEIEVLFRTYDYKNDPQNIILFLSNLKEETL
jgi:hypothetical protein